MREDVQVTDAASLLRAYDDQLREDGELGRTPRQQRHGPVIWAEPSWGGFVTYRSLGGVAGPALDRLIADTVAHFRDDTAVESFEWKTRGHDAPADLGTRLEAHGLVPEELETVMIGEATLLAVPVEVEGVAVRRAGDGADLVDDLTRMLALQEEVFGLGRGPRLAAALTELEAGDDEYWLAEADGTIVSAGRLSLVRGTEFAGLWGGATHEQWRGRGIYRALVAARAASAIDRGVTYLHSDCSPMSRPILERSGLVAVTTSTPYVWTR